MGRRRALNLSDRLSFHLRKTVQRIEHPAIEAPTMTITDSGLLTFFTGLASSSPSIAVLVDAGSIDCVFVCVCNCFSASAVVGEDVAIVGSAGGLGAGAVGFCSLGGVAAGRLGGRIGVGSRGATRPLRLRDGAWENGERRQFEKPRYYTNRSCVGCLLGRRARRCCFRGAHGWGRGRWRLLGWWMPSGRGFLW